MAGHIFDFTHWRNHDGTYGSHCPDCLRTICFHVTKADMEDVEENHLCRECVDRLIREKQLLLRQN